MRSKAIETGEIDGHEYFIIAAPFEDALNGYIHFKNRPVRDDGYDGILRYVPVHGGITYAEHDSSGSIYGFDTLHHDSDQYPRNDPEWMKKQIKVMLDGILVAAKVENKYLKCRTNKCKAKYAQMVQDVQPDQGMNFGVSLNLLSGKL